MFFILSKILIYLTKPFLLLFAMLMLSFIIKNKRWRKRLRLICLMGFLLVTNGFLISEVMRAWEIPATPLSDLQGEYEVGIVLGGGADVMRKPHDRLFLNKSGERITQAVHLYRAGKIKKILYTGAHPKLFVQELTDNEPVIRYYLDCGIPREDIIIESAARNTYENALFSAQIVDSGKTHILITSAFHMRRSTACFEKAGIRVVPFSCNFNSAREDERFTVNMLIPSAEAMIRWDILIKEWIGTIAYKAAGYI